MFPIFFCHQFTGSKVRWRPSHQGTEGNEIADEWAKLAADEPAAHGVEWLSTTNPDGSITERKFPLPRSLANVKRPLRAEVDRLQELGKKEVREDEQPQVLPRRKAKTGPHGGKGQQAPRRPVLPAEDGPLPDRTIPQWKSQQKILWTTVLEETKKLPGPTRGRTAPTSRSCSPTSGAVRRFLFS